MVPRFSAMSCILELVGRLASRPNFRRPISIDVAWQLSQNCFGQLAGDGAGAKLRRN